MAASRKLIDMHRHDSKSLSLPSLLLVDGDEAMVDLALDNPDLGDITSHLLFPK